MATAGFAFTAVTSLLVLVQSTAVTCVPVRSCIFKNLTLIFCAMAGFFRRQYFTFCTSGFMDDFVFSQLPSIGAYI